MHKKNRPAPHRFAIDDPLAFYRERTLYALAVAAVLFAFPLAVDHLAQRHLLLGTGILFGTLIVVCDALALHFRRKPPLPYALLALPAIGCTLLSLRAYGLPGALWAYPAIALYFLLLDRRAANICSALHLLAVMALVERDAGPEAALGIGVTLLLTLLLMNGALHIIGDLHARLHAQSIRDPLTGAYNRRHMQACLEWVIRRRHRGGTPASLLLLDVDRFRLLNDAYGEAAGDDVLRQIAAIVVERIRAVDLLFRIGGGTFVLLLCDTGESAAAGLAEDLRHDITQTCRLLGYGVTLSAGVSQLREERTVDAWLGQASDALQLAKDMGRDRTVRRTGLYLLRTERG